MQSVNFVKITLRMGVRNRLTSSELVPIIPAGTCLFGVLITEYQDRYDIRVGEHNEPWSLIKEAVALETILYEDWNSIKLKQRMAASETSQEIYNLKQEGKLDPARTLCERAIVEYSAVEDIASSEWVKDIQANLGDILLQQGQFEAAIPHLETAARFFENKALGGSDRSGIWTAIFAWIGIAKSWLALGQATEAITAVKRLLSLVKFAKTKFPGGKIDLLIDIAELCLETNLIIEARASVTQADRMFKKDFADYLSIEGTDAAKRARVLQDRLVTIKRKVTDPQQEHVINFAVKTDSYHDARVLVDYLLRTGGDAIAVTKDITPSGSHTNPNSKPRFVVSMKLTVIKNSVV